MSTTVKRTKKAAATQSSTGRKAAKKQTASKKQVAAATKNAPKSATRKPTHNGFHPGIYTVPRGHVTLAVPTFWSLRQTNDDVQVESEASETTVVVTAYQRNEGYKSLDAREYLDHFLETAPVKGRVQKGTNTKSNATARFHDEEGDNWLVRFLSNGQTLLLGTCHSNLPLTSREGRTGIAVLDSIKLKAKA